MLEASPPVLLSLLCTCLLAGCASYAPRPLDLEQTAVHYDAGSLADPGLRAWIETQRGRPLGAWPPAAWDRSLLDLAAGYAQPALRAARAREAAAQAGRAAAAVHPGPALAFPYEVALHQPGGGHPVTTGPALEWPVLSEARRAAARDAAEAEADAARAQAASLAWQIDARVRAGLLAEFGAVRRIALLDALAGVRREQAALIDARLRTGIAAAPELESARLAQARAEAELDLARRSRREARAQLAAAIGLPDAVLQAARLDTGAFAHPVRAPEPVQARHALLARADLRGAVADYAAAQAALQLEVARQYPDIRLGLGYTYDAGADKLAFGLASAALPPLDLNRAAIARASARREEAAARAEAVYAAARAELDDALDARASSTRAWAQARARADAARDAQARRGAIAAAGQADRLELLGAQADRLAAELAELDALLGLQAAQGRIEDALQQPAPIHPSEMSAGAAP